MSDIFCISGSPSASSRSAQAASYIGRSLDSVGWNVVNLSVRELPAADLLHGQVENPRISEAILQLQRSSAIVVATPVYKAAYSGLLKAFLDLLPQDALRGKVVLPIATSGSLAHCLSIEYALKPVLCALGAQTILSGICIVDSQVIINPSGDAHFDIAVEERLASAVRALDVELSREWVGQPAGQNGLTSEKKRLEALAR